MSWNRRLIIYLAVFLLILISWASACVLWQAAEIGERVGPLEPQSYPSLTFVFAGTGTAYEDPLRRGPSTVVALQKEMLLVDAGRGAADGLRAAGIPVTQPSLVLLTSLSPVNTVGLDDVLYTGWLRDRPEPLRVIGPPGTQAWIESLAETNGPGRIVATSGLGLEPAGGALIGEDAGDGFSFDWNGVKITAGALTNGPIPALAWKFERLGKAVVIAGTGWDPEGLVAFSESVDLLVHEAVYVPPPEEAADAGVLTDPERLRRERALHTSIEDIGTLATRAKVRSLALVRLRPPPFFSMQVQSVVGDTYDGQIIVPDEGDELVP